jgi:hypothetical protein
MIVNLQRFPGRSRGKLLQVGFGSLTTTNLILATSLETLRVIPMTILHGRMTAESFSMASLWTTIGSSHARLVFVALEELENEAVAIDTAENAAEGWTVAM